jgi:hypothetical protein
MLVLFLRGTKCVAYDSKVPKIVIRRGKIMTAKIDFYGKEYTCLKAALHMHSTTSDGKFTLQELCDIYSAEGFDVYAATDHCKTNPVSQVDSGDMLMISGMEIHPMGPRGIGLHIVALNVPEDFENPSDLPFQEAIDAVRAAGGECILAHPYWCGQNAVDIMEVKNLIGVEVYNTSTRYIGKSYNMAIWDNILALGYFLPAIATDDTHSLRELFGGWTMICAEEKTPAGVMAALKAGSHYATQGPEFHKLGYEDGKFSVECSPCTEVIVMGNHNFGKCGIVPGYNATTVEEVRNPKLEEMTSFETEIPERPEGAYLRCQITDKNGKMAWSAPIKA